MLNFYNLRYFVRWNLSKISHIFGRQPHRPNCTAPIYRKLYKHQTGFQITSLLFSCVGSSFVMKLDVIQWHMNRIRRKEDEKIPIIGVAKWGIHWYFFFPVEQLLPVVCIQNYDFILLIIGYWLKYIFFFSISSDAHFLVTPKRKARNDKGISKNGCCVNR